MSDKYSQNLFDRAKQYATDPPKTSKRIIQKTAEAIGGSMVITKVSKNLEQNISDMVTNEHDKEMPKERYVSPEVRQ